MEDKEKAQVSNIIIWILAVVPVVGVLFQFGSVVFLAVNIGLSYWDEKKLDELGYDVSGLGAAWIIPVYLYKRAKMLNHGLAYFITWIVCFTISFL